MLGEQCLQVVLSTDFTDFTDFCYTARHQGHQWLKINVDARRALSIIFLNLRFLLIELIFATHRGGNMSAARHQGN
ncbi:MAG: hypothetical protein KIG61_08035, partial [Muribaculaceae bacterium]|nr:hypothetical protein [Muribaculaceae bacterium]